MKFLNQFLLTKRKGLTIDGFLCKEISGYQLYFQLNLETSEKQHQQTKIILLGYCFDYRNPTFTTQDIVDRIDITLPLEEIIDQLRFLSGVYIVVLSIESSCYVIPDLCAFREIYYRHEINNLSVSSSHNLLKLDDPDYNSELVEDYGFYQSAIFKSRLIGVGDQTQFSGIKKLKPNHYLNLANGNKVRFFPNKKNLSLSIDEATDQATIILKGILTAVTYRGPVMMGLTAGWDSRLLLAASKEVKDHILYFVMAHKDADFDIKVSERLANHFGLNHARHMYSASFNKEKYNHVKESLENVNLDYAGLFATSSFLPRMVNLSGAGGEITRLEFGKINSLSGEKLAALAKYPKQPYPIRVYSKWIDENDNHFKRLGYDTLDLFYWEEILSNKAAKIISEAHAVNRLIFPVFNCRALITTLLSVESSFRQKQNNYLYLKIIKKLWPETLREPINPSFKKRVIRIMQRLMIYNLYRNIFPTGIPFIK